MRCHSHADQEAVAICKHCMKGLCGECVVDGAGGAACSDACAKEIALAHAVLRRSGANLELQRAGPLFAGVLLMLVGLAFVGHGALREEGKMQVFQAGVGSLLALFGVGAYFVWKHYRDRGA